MHPAFHPSTPIVSCTTWECDPKLPAVEDSTWPDKSKQLCPTRSGQTYVGKETHARNWLHDFERLRVLLPKILSQSASHDRQTEAISVNFAQAEGLTTVQQDHQKKNKFHVHSLSRGPTLASAGLILARGGRQLKNWREYDKAASRGLVSGPRVSHSNSALVAENHTDNLVPASVCRPLCPNLNFLCLQPHNPPFHVRSTQGRGT